VGTRRNRHQTVFGKSSSAVLEMTKAINSHEERSLDHAKAGYKNSQEIIRFLDSKCGAVIGLVTLVTSLPFVIFKWIAEQKPDSPWCLGTLAKDSPKLWWIAAGFAVLGVASGLIALLTALHGLRARSRSGGGPTPILFPMLDPNKNLVDATQSFSRLQAGLSYADIVHEYEGQLLNVGMILHAKAQHLRRAFWFLGAQAILHFLAFVFAILAITR